MRIKKWIELLLALCAVGLLVNVLVVFLSQEGINWSDPWGWIFAYDVGLAMFWFLLCLGVLAMVHWSATIFTRKNVISWALVLVAVVASLFLFELIMKPFSLVFNAANLTGIDFNQRKAEADRHPGEAGTLKAREYWWAKDEELGYGPLMGPKYAYSELGALQNSYALAKPKGVVRVIFVGDSITAYGFTQDALAEINPAKNYQYWNTGVWGYSTWQELRYFQRYGRKLKPDVVILGFCLNDWDGTPVILKDQDGHVAIANMHLGQDYFNYWLFQHSTIYRMLISVLASASHRAGVTESVRNDLRTFQRYAKEDGFAFRVVVYPELDRLDKWEKGFQEHRQRILGILKELKIPYYDTAPLLDKALKDRPREWARMVPGDHFHPSRAFSMDIAQELMQRGFLNPPKAAAGQ